MPDRIVMDKFYGDVIEVSGKCWEFIGLDDSTPQFTSGDISQFFATCNDCLSGNNPLIVPPSGLSQSMGDVHYIYGDPSTIAIDPTSASFNVDDNISTNEIVWWTHTESGVEYVIKYTQQEFTYTSGGLSIDQVVVSASDLSVNDTYTLTDPQSATLRNGGSWLNLGVSGLGTAMSYNITERIIPPSECSAILNEHFGLFNLEVFPNSGFYNMDENGGALWYVWKQLATAYGAGAVNNPSSANFDGLGTFLSGINGYNARSQFEATPSTVRETFDSPTASAIIDKLKELSAIDGLWVADWDPLVQDPLVCPPTGKLDCGTPNADPTLDVTVTWTDADATKDYLGCTWTNGECKEVYATSYNLQYNPRPVTGTDMNINNWNRVISGDKLGMAGTTILATTTFSDAKLGEIDVIRNQDTNFDLNIRVSYWFGSRYSTLVNNTNVASYIPALTMLSYGVPIGSTNRNGTVTTTNGLTITWTEGTGW